MDLSLNINTNGENIDHLYIRVAVIGKTKNGYIFEKNKRGYYFVIGGKVQFGETFLEAAKREVEEEIIYNVKSFLFRGILENFYTQENISTHEISFIYEIEELVDIKLSENFYEMTEKDILENDVRPSVLKDIIFEKDRTPKSYVLRK
jgi:8-oxo-dGTP pyrophosphatase MutT (NUDIX family)